MFLKKMTNIDLLALLKISKDDLDINLDGLDLTTLHYLSVQNVNDIKHI